MDFGLADKTVLVLGATGGLGAEVARQLVVDGWQVRTLHRRASVTPETRAGITWLRGDALNAADVLLMPYLDGASLRRGTLMAGLANGCAIVTTWPQDPLPELVHERDLVYVPAEDDAAMAAAVTRLAQDAPLRTRLQSNARDASQQFGWEEIARRHLEIYATGIPRESA